MAVTKQDEFLEAAFDLGQWFERHWKSVLRWAGVALVLAIVVAAVFGWRQHRASQATASLAQGADAFNRAAAAQYGDFDALADALVYFEAAEAKAGSADPGPLATYYRGVTLFRLGRRDEAIEALESFVGKAAGDQPLDWAGTALLAGLHAEGGNSTRAIELLEAASDRDAYPQDQVLLQLGRIRRDAGDTAAARGDWQSVLDEYPNSAGAREARRLLED